MSFGLAFLFRNILYLIFSMFIGYLGYKMYKLKKVGLIVFIIVWMLPYYDLFIQKGIKTYYEIFKMNNTIYAYPERDKDGKIESLGVGRNDSTMFNYFETQKEVTKYGLQWKKFVSNFVELYLYDTTEKVIDEQGKIKYKERETPISEYVRLYLNKHPIYYEKIKDESDYKARYQVLGKSFKSILHTEEKIEFWDTKENKLLAIAYRVFFNGGKDYNDKFRNKYLLFRGPSGVALSITRCDNYRTTYNELFFNSKSKNK